jgi:hypothetical protein
MKSIIFSIMAPVVLVGCTLPGGAARNSTSATMRKATTVNQPTSQHLMGGPDGFAFNAVAGNTYEVTYSGPWLGSRDAIEGRLLYRAALLTSQHGKTWFRFLHMPGEDGPLSHPSRQSPSFGAAYGHWQPHWSFETALGWQPWHPEWGVPFWAETPDGKGVKQVQVHAMIRLRNGPPTEPEQTDFNAAGVLRDLRPTFE